MVYVSFKYFVLDTDRGIKIFSKKMGKSSFVRSAISRRSNYKSLVTPGEGVPEHDPIFFNPIKK